MPLIVAYRFLPAQYLPVVFFSFRLYGSTFFFSCTSFCYLKYQFLIRNTCP